MSQPTTDQDSGPPSPQSVAEWTDDVLSPSLERLPNRREQFTTLSGLPVKDLYSPADVAEIDFETEIGYPGSYPFTRGPHATMFRSRPWTIRQVAGFGTAADTNQRYRYLLDHGETGLSTDFDLPTLLGRDSNHKMAQAEIGRIGVAVDTVGDVETLLDGIPLDEISTSFTINGSAFALIAMYESVARRQGVARNQITGTCQNDILKEYTAQNEFIYPPAPAVKLVVDTMEFCRDTMPRYNPVSVSGYHIREAGATAVEELAFTLGAGYQYAQSCSERGIPVDEIAPRISFFFDIHNDFFEEIAKLRAARRLWARMMREWLGATDERSWLMRAHCQTAGVSLTAQQPINNVARTAVQALAAVLGGTQSLHTNSMDEAFQVPSEEAIKVAVRTQQILLMENGVGDVVDPLAGSYYVESLTSRLEEEAAELIHEVHGLGGMIPAVEEGFIQRRIADSAARFQDGLESGDETMVGVNAFVDETEADPPFEVFEIDPQTAERQIAELERVRRTRDGKAVVRALRDVEAAARTDRNVMGPVSQAVEAHASVGELCDVLREVYGEYKPLAVF